MVPMPIAEDRSGQQRATATKVAAPRRWPERGMRSRRNGILRPQPWTTGPRQRARASRPQGAWCMGRYGAVKRVGGTTQDGRHLSAGGGGIGSWPGSRPAGQGKQQSITLPKRALLTTQTGRGQRSRRGAVRASLRPRGSAPEALPRHLDERLRSARACTGGVRGDFSVCGSAAS